MNFRASFYPTLYLGIALSSVIPIAPMVTTAVHAQATETMIYVNPDRGNDGSATGSREQPYQTLTDALANAQRNTVIKLAPGTYSEETGEQFPIIVRKAVEIRGTPSNQGIEVKIEGGGLFNSPTGAGQNVGLALLADATLTGVTVTNQRDRGHGVWVEGASPTVTQNSFRRNDSTGLSVNGFGKPRISDNYFYSNAGNGMVIYGRSEPIVENNTFERTGFGISIAETAKPQLLGNEIKHNRIGVVVEGKAQPLLRNNTIALSHEQGLVAISNSRPNLGTDKQPGGNIFRRNREEAIKNVTKEFVIPAHGNEINGKTVGEIDLTGTVAIPEPVEASPQPNLATQDSRSANSSSSQEQVWTAPSADAPSLSPDANASPLRIDRDLPPPVSSSQLIPPGNSGSGGNAVRGEIQLSSPPNPSSRNNPTNNTPTPSQSTNKAPSSSNNGRASLGDILSLHSNSSPPERNPNSLPVPDREIPSGNQFRPGTSPEERAAEVGGDYRVIVEVNNVSDRNKVKSVVPNAFTSRYQGRSVMQVGIFQSQANAEEIRQKLRQKGLQVRVIPVTK